MVGQELVDKSTTGRVRPWKEHKINSGTMVDRYDYLIQKGHEGYRSKAQRMRECGSRLTFVECKEHGYRKLQKAFFCKARLCPLCTWRKSLFTYHQFNQVAHKVIEDHPGTKFLFVTLTSKNVNGDGLKAELRGQAKAFGKMLRYKRVQGAVKGFFRSSEVTYNPERKNYHPHIHAILAVNSRYFKNSEYIKQAEWTELWQKALKVDYKPRVDVRKVKAKHQGVPTIQEDLAAVGAEVAKYSVTVKDIIAPAPRPKDSWGMKDAKLQMRNDPVWQADVIHTLEDQLHKVRMQGYGGILKDAYGALNMTDVEQSDLITMPDEQAEVCTCPICQSELSQVHVLWHPDRHQYLYE